MQVNVQKLSPVLAELEIQVPQERVKSEVDKAYNSVRRTARVRGFRPGKAPRKVLAHVYGGRIAQDVAQRLVDETFPKAVSEQNLQPVNSPAIESQKLVETEPFSYKARVEIVPEIESVAYEGLEAKRPKVAVDDSHVTEELDKLRQAHATLEPPKKERAAAKGDVVTIDFTIEVEGEDIADAGATDFQVELGGGQLLGPIDEALAGKKVGEDAQAEVDMPAGHPHKGLAGKTAIFKLKIKDLKEKVLPEADDEFAKDLGDFDTLADLQAKLREGLEKQHKEQSDNTLAERLVQQLVEKNPIPLPPSLVERQARLTEQEILGRARANGQQATGLGDELREKVRTDSEVKVRAGLLMAEIAKKEGIQIGDAEIEEGLQELAEQTGKNVAKLRAEYRDQKKREMLIGMILENKVLDIIEAKAKISEE